MQGETESTVQKEMDSLQDCVSHMISGFTTNTSSSELFRIADQLTNTFAAVDHEQLTMKETLKELLHTEEKELELLNEARSESLGSGVTLQISQLAQSNRQKNSLEEEISSLKNSISHTEEMDKHLEQRLKASNQQALTTLPKVNAKSQMYVQVSRLKWDYTAPEDVIKGFVLHPKKREVTSFKIDKSSHSQFFITNFLWQQIGANCDF